MSLFFRLRFVRIKCQITIKNKITFLIIIKIYNINIYRSILAYRRRIIRSSFINLECARNRNNNDFPRKWVVSVKCLTIASLTPSKNAVLLVTVN